MDDLILVLGLWCIPIGIVFFGAILPDIMYNNGVHRRCGGKWVFVNKTYAEQDFAEYKCNKCGREICH